MQLLHEQCNDVAVSSTPKVMKKISINELDPEILQLFDQYVHDLISRRQFLHNAAKYLGGGITAAAVLSFLTPRYSTAYQVSANDPRLREEYIEYESPDGGGTIRALLTWSSEASEPQPGVVVAHENRGLNPYIEDVCRRVALAGFVGLAPDMLTPLGGYPGNDDDGRALQRQRGRGKMLEDFIAAYHTLREHEKCTGSVGVVGFCFGGSIANHMATRLPELGAAVPFYGGAAPLEDVSAIQAPLLLHFAEQDARVNAGWPPYEEALKEHEKTYTANLYPAVQHGFHNDTTPRYNEEAAKLAWERTVDFFNQHLR